MTSGVTGSGRVVRIGGASGALNDSVIAVPQLLRVPDLNYLAFDYLGEGAMGIFARLKQMDPASGFLPDFVDLHIGPYLAELKARGIRVVANAGGLNPEGLAALIRARGAEQGLALKVATVSGDDILPLTEALRAEGVRDMFNGAQLPARPGSFHAYLGAFPIAAALGAGADIVITGRVADSSMILGPLIHEFGWGPDDYDLLAGGTVAGHLLECGAQVSGGTFTDWQDVPDWAEIGFPVGECHADGTVVITVPDGTGGLVSVGTVSEQLLYEVSDPQAYIVPDVVVDFSGIALEQVGPNRVRVSGAKGYPATDSLKACATFDAGWRSVALIPVTGIDAVAKAERQAEALLRRCSRLLRERNLPDYTLTHVELIGTETAYGPRRQHLAPREVLLKIVVDHPDMGAAMQFGREQTTAIMNMAQGTSIAPIIAAPRAFPLTDMAFCLIGRDRAHAAVRLDGVEVAFADPVQGGFDPAAIVRAPAPVGPAEPGTATVPLIRLAWARSGDKGRLFNVAVIARSAEYLPYLRAALSEQAVADWYRHLFDDPATGRVERFDVPGIHALNFVVHDAQGGGINVSPRLDAAAKSMAQLLLEMSVPVPAALAAQVGE
ncbi:acyclic terpene utilization AtuA family protein [Novosphingobium sp.]|uniref:acyclic terpene utilization AtuA family protein n=1 Tax=Novosphingobium sp. TaxID=1874826 RepID=UPI002735AF4B|nr:acyclic terpene utilization AtuA family protein [Novosphingobium sp.]MDP3906860.1 acyclic terpene utilization AtuA family protein [Novosphingobium sp.]